MIGHTSHDQLVIQCQRSSHDR